MHRWGLTLLAGCGRIGFDAPGGGAGVDAPGDSVTNGDATDASTDAMIDAPPGSMMTFTFGEAPVTMFKSVSRDTFVSNEAGETLFNYGADDEVRMESDAGERALIWFDLVAIPTSATVISATLTVVNIQIPPAPLPIEIHRVLESWDEGNQTGTGGVANFTTRSSAIPWLNPGAGSPLSSSATLGTFTPAMGSQVIALPVAMVQAWVSSASTNNGMVLISTSPDSTRFTTSEGSPTSSRPVLTVTFTP